MPFDTEVTLFTQFSGLVRIVETVRTTILSWSLKLEEDGILGEGLSFTADEKQQAAAHAQNVTYFFGPVTGAQLQQGSDRPVQVSAVFNLDATAVEPVVEQIRAELADLGLSPAARAEAEAELETVDAQLRSPRPKSSIVRESLQSLRSVLEGAAGGAAGHLIIELGKLLG